MASGSGDDEGNAEGGSWRLVGPAAELSSKRCRLMYSPLGRGSDVCLFYVKGEFFAMDARCAHSGKKKKKKKKERKKTSASTHSVWAESVRFNP